GTKRMHVNRPTKKRKVYTMNESRDEFTDRTIKLTQAVNSLGVALTAIESDDPADAPADKGWTLSIPVRTDCTDCAIPLTDRELVARVRAIGRTVRSEWSRQHGCGAWPELVQRAVRADDVTDNEGPEIARQLAAERDRRAAELDARRRARQGWAERRGGYEGTASARR